MQLILTVHLFRFKIWGILAILPLSHSFFRKVWPHQTLFISRPLLPSVFGLNHVLIEDGKSAHPHNHLTDRWADRETVYLFWIFCKNFKYCITLQKIYKTNNMNNPAAHAQYQLSELELPSKRPSSHGLCSTPPPGKSVLADMTYSIEMVR